MQSAAQATRENYIPERSVCSSGFRHGTSFATCNILSRSLFLLIFSPIFFRLCVSNASDTNFQQICLAHGDAKSRFFILQGQVKGLRQKHHGLFFLHQS